MKNHWAQHDSSINKQSSWEKLKCYASVKLVCVAGVRKIFITQVDEKVFALPNTSSVERVDIINI